MNRSQLYQLADEHGRFAAGWVFNIPGLEALVRDAVLAEREACAKLAEAFHQHGYDFTGDLELHEAIRSRSTTREMSPYWKKQLEQEPCNIAEDGVCEALECCARST